MPDSNFWRDLSEQFESIDDPFGFLRANWREGANSAQTICRIETPRNEYPTLVAKAEALARRGGIEVNPFIDSLAAWIEVLRERGINTDREGGVRIAGQWRSTGTITNFAQASAILSRRLEAEALEAERIAKIKQTEDVKEIRSQIAAIDSTDQPAKSATVGEQIDRLREECRWTQERLTELTGFDQTTISRHIRNEMTPSLRNLHKYERLFAKHLKREVVIKKTPTKRLQNAASRRGDAKGPVAH